MIVEIFGVLAVGSMVITYALERRSSNYVLGFAASCAAASLYAGLIHSWPFAVVEGLWALVAFRRWMRVRSFAIPAAEVTLAKEVPMRPQPLIAVRDVEASSRWYQRLLGCKSAHGGPEYERLVHQGVLILQLHNWDVEHHHGAIGDPEATPYGNGVLLWFETDELDAVVARATAMEAEIVKPPHRNPPSGEGGPNHRECWLRDLDGYTIVVASPDGEAGRPS